MQAFQISWSKGKKQEEGMTLGEHAPVVYVDHPQGAVVWYAGLRFRHVPNGVANQPTMVRATQRRDTPMRVSEQGVQ
jgi:hypothetical protein